MANLKITMVQNAYVLSRYLDGVEAKDGSGVRAWFTSAVGTRPKSFAYDVMRNERAFGKKPKNSCLHAIFGFSDEEFDPNDIDAGFAATQRVRTIAQEMWPGHMMKIATQRDGVSRRWHVHVAVAMVSSWEAETLRWETAQKSETGKAGYVSVTRRPGLAMTDQMRSWKYLHKVHDDVLREEFGFDNVKLMKSRQRSKIVSIGDRERRADGRYVWRDDLRDRVDASISKADSMQSFTESMDAVGVEVRLRDKTGISFGFTDDEKKQRASSGSKLGANYSRSAIELRLTTLPAPQKTRYVEIEAVTEEPASAPLQPAAASAPLQPPVPSFSSGSFADFAKKAKQSTAETKRSTWETITVKSERTQAIIEQMPEFETYAAAQITKGEAWDDARVPVGLGPKFLETYADQFQPDVLRVLQQRSAKLEEAREAGDAVAMLDKMQPELVTAEMTLKRTKQQATARALREQVKSGRYESMPEETAAAVQAALQGQQEFKTSHSELFETPDGSVEEGQLGS